jgi:hypothetical protein
VTTWQAALRGGDPVCFDLDDREYRWTPPQGCRAILAYLSGTEGYTDALDLVLTGLDGRDRKRLLARLDDPLDGLDLPQVSEIARRLVCACSGRDWSFTVNLVGATLGHWEALDGKAAMAGVDLLSLPLVRLLDASWHAFTEHADAKDTEALRARLSIPISEEFEDEGEWSDDETFAAFEKARGQMVDVAVKGKVD